MKSSVIGFFLHNIADCKIYFIDVNMGFHLRGLLGKVK